MNDLVQKPAEGQEPSGLRAPFSPALADGDAVGQALSQGDSGRASRSRWSVARLHLSDGGFHLFRIH
ncbi:MAG TPA: hypothetical protein VKG66_00480 [Steroidobacteraceae bacterium]|nr:hypothetical protein [Steroidobacteraceae bacterium]